MPLCCDGLEREGDKCIDGNITDPTPWNVVGPDDDSAALDYLEDMNSEDTEACAEGACCNRIQHKKDNALKLILIK